MATKSLRDTEFAAPHSITSSARARTDVGMSMPSALAVLRLMTSSYLVGACTGRSAGVSPLDRGHQQLAGGRLCAQGWVPSERGAPEVVAPPAAEERGAPRW